MGHDMRFATILEIRHFRELIFPLELYDCTGAPISDNNGALIFDEKIVQEMQRFGYVPKSEHLLVRVDPDDCQPSLTEQQARFVSDEMMRLYLRAFGIVMPQSASAPKWP